jgi:Ca2+/H+ antiporter, TMEM165/GDT1 family
MSMHGWTLFISVFGVVFVAKLPDKTPLAALVLATRHRPVPVLIGAATALTNQSLVAVAVGQLVSLLPHRPVHIFAGGLFLVSAVLMWRRKDEAEEGASEKDGSAGFWRSAWIVFVVAFIAEWGDLTQLATGALAAHYHSPHIVFGGATLALWAVAGIAVFLGHRRQAARSEPDEAHRGSPVCAHRYSARRGAAVKAGLGPLVLGALLVDTRNARAADPPGDTQTLPCRPTIACTADFVPPGAFELESGALFRHLGSSGRQWTFPFLAKLTLVPWFQFQVGSNGYSVAHGDVPEQFLDDVQIGGKIHLVDQQALRPSLSFSALASIPTVQGQGYLRTYDALLTAYVTKDFGPLHADFNVGENVWRVEGEPRPQEFVALAVSMNLPPPFGVMAESYYFTNAAPVAMRDGGFLFALSQSPRPWLMFDAGGDIGMFPSTRAYSVFFGMSVVPVLLWRSPVADR